MVLETRILDHNPHGSFGFVYPLVLSSSLLVMAAQDTWNTPATAMWKYGKFFRELKTHPEKPTGAWGKPHKVSWIKRIHYWGVVIIGIGASGMGILDVLFVATVLGLIAYELFGYRLIEQRTIRIAAFSGVVSLLAIAFFSFSTWTGYETKPGYSFRHLVWKQRYDLSQMIHPIVQNGVIRLQRS